MTQNTPQNLMIAITYIEAEANEDEETIELIHNEINPRLLASCLAEIGAIFAITYMTMFNNDEDLVLGRALEHLRKVILKDDI